jgi:hypothetical protein
MLTLKQIILAIDEVILAKFPTIEIQATDVKEGFKRPSFFVQLDNISSDTGLYFSKRSMTTRIYYFPSNRHNYSLELIDMQDGLESIFKLNFEVENRVITIAETRGQTIDGVLEFEFDFEFTEKLEIEDLGDPMEELDYNG